MAVNQRQLRLLLPYLEGEEPTHHNKDGLREWNMACPLHEDDRRSASLNYDTGEWWCFAGCGGGSVTDLIRRKDEWVEPSVVASNGRPRRGRSQQTEELPTEGHVGGWHSSLMADELRLDEFLVERGLTMDTVVKYEVGWDSDRKIYTIPVRGEKGELLNVRRYTMHPRDGGRKIWGIRGHNDPRLYPLHVLEAKPERIIICEGELDALITLQNGYDAITRTAAADVWRGEWGKHFKDRTVYICHDMDFKGQKANKTVAQALARVADVRILLLPYEIVPKHGKDLTDYWQEHDRDDFEQLLRQAEQPGERKPDDPDIITVLESFDARRVAEPVKVLVTIKGRKEPGYTVPKKVHLACSQDKGPVCNVCPMNAAGGEADMEIAPDDPAVLAMMDAPTQAMLEAIRESYGVPVKCNRLKFEIEEHQAVEILFARPSLDHVGDERVEAGDYKNLKITSVGRHNTPPNQTVLITGALQPNPRSQGNEFQVWELEPMETSVDRFEITQDVVALMRRFQTAPGERPLAKLGEISRMLAAHVTRIHGRPEMHALMDLVFHSVLSFKFAGDLIHRGWLEGLVVGDTRTGKSEAAAKMARHYGAGEIIGGEAASFAGIIGGLQQIGGKDWAVTWGVVPMNDRRLVVLDEISGLTTDQISQMSDVRSSGIARLIKIQQEVTWARTRLLWLSNPRNAAMSNFTYGVDALKPLIGNMEDIARFDLAMAVTLYDVPAEEINRPYSPGQLRYTSEACHALLMWAWTRQPDQIVWAPGAEDAVFDAANAMGRRYVEDPPLIQAANVRIKIARAAAALAARTFSTDASHERLIINSQHVSGVVAFLDRIYDQTAFGYRERSREYIADREHAEHSKAEIQEYLKGYQNLAKYLRSTGSFRRQDLEEVLNIYREEANAIISKLHEARMVRKDKGDIRVEPTLHALLREVKW